jgi:hypothetical protein
MDRRTFTTAALAAAVVRGNAEAQSVPAKAQLLGTLRRGHPRIMIDGQTRARLKATIAASPAAARIYKSQRAEADRILAAGPPSTRSRTAAGCFRSAGA